MVQELNHNKALGSINDLLGCLYTYTYYYKLSCNIFMSNDYTYRLHKRLKFIFIGCDISYTIYICTYGIHFNLVCTIWLGQSKNVDCLV